MKRNKMNYVIKKKFKSKKNEVYLIRVMNDEKEKYFVLKKYKSTENFKKESDYLIQLKSLNVKVPDVVYKGENYIIMEYLAGKPLVEVFDLLEKGSKSINSISQTIDSLFEWFQNFYCSVKKIYKENIVFRDVNLRNFLLVGNEVYGIDFEDCCGGYIEEDAGRLCAYMLTYLPPFTPCKVALTKRLFYKFIEKLNLNQKFVIKEIRKELISIEKRRGLIIPLDIMEMFQPN